MDFRFKGKKFKFRDLPEDEHITKRILKKKTFYELDMLEALADLVPGKGWIVDCGANIGNHTVFFAGVMGQPCLAFEPVDKNRAVLERLVKANGLQARVDIRGDALGDEAGEVTLATPSIGNAGMYRIVTEISDGETAPLTRLDDALRADQIPIQLIKIDVEGYEAKVLRGARETVARDRPIIAAELASVAEYDQFRYELDQHGYVASALYNATPTVIFLPEGSETGPSIRPQIAEYEKKTKSAD